MYSSINSLIKLFLQPMSERVSMGSAKHFARPKVIEN